MAAANTGAIVGAVLGSLLGILIIYAFFSSFIIVREKQQVVLERFGRFKAVLTPGVHMILPFIDRPKKFSARYYLENGRGQPQLIEKLNQTRVMTQVRMGR